MAEKDKEEEAKITETARARLHINYAMEGLLSLLSDELKMPSRVRMKLASTIKTLQRAELHLDAALSEKP